MYDETSDSAGPIGVIFDTDMATDCDDAGALAMLHGLEQRGEADILATVTNNRGDRSIGVVAAINAFYGRADVNLGAYQGDEVGQEAADFFADIATDTDRYGHTVTSRSQVPSAVEVYRRVLSNADSNTVRIVSVGHLNVLYSLLRSDGDEYSPLTGPELIEDRVDRLIVMGGEYPAGAEHNFSARGSSPFTGPALEAWPTRVVLSGYELGDRIRTGPGLRSLDDRHPVRRAYAGHPSNPLENGRPSWDQTAVLAAVHDPERYWEMSSSGRVAVGDDGSNSWVDDLDGTHRYLKVRSDIDPGRLEEIIEELMVEAAPHAT